MISTLSLNRHPWKQGFWHVKIIPFDRASGGMDNASDCRSEDSRNYFFWHCVNSTSINKIYSLCPAFILRRRSVIGSSEPWFLQGAGQTEAHPAACFSQPAWLLSGKNSSTWRCFQWDALPSTLEGAHVWASVCRQTDFQAGTCWWVSLPTGGHNLTCPLPQQLTKSLGYTFSTAPILALFSLLASHAHLFLFLFRHLVPKAPWSLLSALGGCNSQAKQRWERSKPDWRPFRP